MTEYGNLISTQQMRYNLATTLKWPKFARMILHKTLHQLFSVGKTATILCKKNCSVSSYSYVWGRSTATRRTACTISDFASSHFL